MKKYLLFSLAIVLILVFAGCKYDSTGEAWTLKKPSLIKKMPVAAETKAIYRCWYSYKGVINHYLSFNNNCEGNNVDGPVGHLYKAQKPNTNAIYQCFRQTRHDSRTYTDHFTSLDPNCEGQQFSALMGYASTVSTSETQAVYRFWLGDRISQRKFDHMVSLDPNGEGYPHKEQTYYFLKQVKYTKQCTGDVKDVLTNNLQRTYIIKDSTYEIQALITGDQVKFRINGQLTENLQQGQIIILADGAKLEVEQIWTGQAVSFCLTASKQISDYLILVNDGAPASDVVISVDISTFLGGEITQTKLDSEVMASKIYEYPLVVRIFLSDVNVLVNPARISEQIAYDLVTHLKQNPRVSDASYKILSETNVRDLAEYSQETTTTQEVSITQTGGNYTGTLVMEGESFLLNYNPIPRILTITLPDNTKVDIAIDSNNLGTWNYQGTTYTIEINIANNRIIFVH